jgi:hypothetical protein
MRRAAARRACALQFLAGTCRDGAFLNHQLGRRGFGSDHARDVVDGAQVGIAIGERWGAHADENGVAGGNGVGGIGAEAQATFLADLGDDLVEAGLVDGHAARFERSDLRSVAIRAHHLMADFRQAITEILN